MYRLSFYCYWLMILVLLVFEQSLSVVIAYDDESSSSVEANHEGLIFGILGGLVDDSFRIGKEEKIAMKMAVQDFYDATNHTLILHTTRSSIRDPMKSALSARYLINKKKVQTILGPYSWEETSLVAKVGNENNIPIVSFANSTPKWATELWPFLVQASPDQHNEMKAIASMVQSWDWYQVTIIYEENSPLNHVLPNLFSALKEVGAEINRLVELPPFISSLLSQELERLKEEQCRVFIVHSSFQFAQLLFEKAKEMKMMEKDYVWIATDPIMNLVHSFNASTIASMQGVLGIRSYFSKDQPRWQDFYNRFRKRFMLEYPKEYNHEPGSFAVQAYDATWAVAQAMERSIKKDGKEVLGNILKGNHYGMGQELRFKDQRLVSKHIFRIVNIVGKSYNDLGFWSDELGFSKTIGKNAKYNSSMKSLGQVFWPGGPWYIPKGWTPQTNSRPLRIGVPSFSLFKQFVNVEESPDDLVANKSTFSGYAIDVFKATIDALPFHLTYEFYSYEGTSYDSFVEQIHLKKFDAVIGDVTIVAHRYEHAEFTLPYTETGLVMIVPNRSRTSNKEWLFLKPFTKSMWILIIVVNLYNGFVIWLIERNYCPKLKGSKMNQIGTLVWLAFSTLFTLQGGKLHSNLTRMAMLVWLFVALVITQTYTANLASMLTVKQLEADIGPLQSGNFVVGYCRGSYLKNYLTHVLGYPQNRIRSFTSEQGYAQALERREIAGVYLEIPLAKLFLAKYCQGYTTIDPTYKVGGFGFAFPRGSPLLPSISKALLDVAESGKLKELEVKMLESHSCTNKNSSDEGETSRLSLRSFWILFVLTIGTSTIALLLYVFVISKSMPQYTPMWWLMMVVMRPRRNRVGDYFP